ncbi:uncharacterized protein F4822DRAFT_408457 [Hypoxylon trugodes]|uniref:uncharacterized protein n=1 Tax=Hypoxylon trugodes TaxID=326681 RepID=UPI002190A520|nr:uncharacterized protein F4822DRAFT_408457 [Hypoxylon trugodes]KAI1388044.1 hypothetical protein F4822DRAFT_408457 [Hypoxylon trugodes]
MAVDYSPRSVADATRFTSNTPHANAKATSNSSSSTSSASSSQKPTSSSPSSRSPQSRMPPPEMPGSSTPETMEERVRRLRAAHLAARKHETSRFDRVVNVSRRYFDAAHKFTVLGLITFSGLALFVTVYATADMMIYNRKRRNEFFALQKQLRADSLEAARLAYMTGTASEDQIALVEEAEAKARQSGISLPPLLSAPRPMVATEGTERTVWPGEALTESNLSGADEVEQPKKKGFTSWLFGGLKKEETSEESLNFDREAAAAAGSTSYSNVTKTIDESQQVLKDKAKAAFEQERENQRKGGPLDQLGLDGKSNGGEDKKKGWW